MKCLRSPLAPGVLLAGLAATGGASAGGAAGAARTLAAAPALAFAGMSVLEAGAEALWGAAFPAGFAGACKVMSERVMVHLGNRRLQHVKKYANLLCLLGCGLTVLFLF